MRAATTKLLLGDPETFKCLSHCWSFNTKDGGGKNREKKIAREGTGKGKGYVDGKKGAMMEERCAKVREQCKEREEEVENNKEKRKEVWKR